MWLRCREVLAKVDFIQLAGLFQRSVTFISIKRQIFENLRDGAVVRILSNTMASPITFLTDEIVQYS